MEGTRMRMSFRQKFIGDKAFYKMVLAVAVPIMIQNGITNFVSMLDNIMIGRVGDGADVRGRPYRESAALCL